MSDALELRSERNLGHSGSHDFMDARFTEPQEDPQFLGMIDPFTRQMSRRTFLAAAGLTLAAVVDAACVPHPPSPTPGSEPAALPTQPRHEATARSSPSPTNPATEAPPTPDPRITGYTVLTTEQMAERGLVGDAIRVETEYEGIPVDATLVTSPSLQKYLPHHIGFGLNPELMDNELPAPQRIAKLVLLGHYRGYMEDYSLTAEAYSFSQYVADLKSGKDMGYYIYGTSMVGSSGRFKVNPLQPVETVFVADKTDPNGNATVYVAEGMNIGFYVTKDGGLRLVVQQFTENMRKRPQDAPTYSLGSMVNILLLLGWPEKAQHYGSIYDPNFNKSDPVLPQMAELMCVGYSPKGYCGSDDPPLMIERTGE